MEKGFTFMCTRCGEKPAVVRRGRKTFLCGACASDAMWHDMVGSITGLSDDDDSTDGS
jgi:hypothetical protein